MSTQYKFLLVREKRDADNNLTEHHTMASMVGPAWEIAPAMKQLSKKIHESPPPVVLEGQESML